MNEHLELISLADLIDQVKADLLAKGASDNPAFFVEGVEIAAQVVASRADTEGGKAGLGINLAVLGFKADAGIDTKTAVSSQSTQTVTIKLVPLLSREEYLAGLDEAERKQLKEKSSRIVTRGGHSGSHDSV